MIVKKPIKGDRFEHKGGNETYMIEVFQREATTLRNLAHLPGAMQLYGSCSDSYATTMNVVEYLERFNVIVVERIGWQTRVQVLAIAMIVCTGRVLL